MNLACPIAVAARQLGDDESWRGQYVRVLREGHGRGPLELVLGHRACQRAAEPGPLLAPVWCVPVFS